VGVRRDVGDVDDVGTDNAEVCKEVTSDFEVDECVSLEV